MTFQVFKRILLSGMKNGGNPAGLVQHIAAKERQSKAAMAA